MCGEGGCGGGGGGGMFASINEQGQEGLLDRSITRDYRRGLDKDRKVALPVCA